MNTTLQLQAVEYHILREHTDLCADRRTYLDQCETLTEEIKNVVY